MGPGGPFGPFGPGGPFGPHGQRRRGRGGRARRGDIRNAALRLLAEGPRNGYQLIQELAQRSDGRWRPSPGAVYPALSQLEDEGLIEACEHEGRKAFRLTEAGQAQAQDLESERAPWEDEEAEAAESRVLTAYGEAVRQFGLAASAVAQTGDERLVAAAAQVLEQARRDLYRLLADDRPADEPQDDIQDDVPPRD